LQVAKAESISVAGQPWDGTGAEAALIRAAQESDHDAFEQLVRLYDRSVLRVALNILRSEDDARDAYQEAFLKAYKSLHSFRFQCSFHTWLYRIVTNVCLDFLRRKGVRKEQSGHAALDGESPGALDLASDERAASNPARVLATQELGRQIALAMQQLSPKEKVVFEMKHYEGLRLRAIGDMLGISEEAAKNCLFRATRKLRTTLGGAA
jgi:RNA polymerase sigma-70 factor (ECF subfamily)